MPAAFFLVMSLFVIAACVQPSSTEHDATPADEVIPTGTSPVVVAELFTSEGCSSCPPADALLAELAERKGVIALAFHVDYWNYLGWSDPFSQEAFSTRQRTYASVLDGRVYTPELVVNGSVGMVGSRRQQVETAIAEALKRIPPIEVTLSTRADGNTVVADYQISDSPDNAVLHLALVQRSTSQDVPRGENRGRRLSHINVVRVFATKPIESGSHEMILPDDLDISNAAVVAYVQTGEVGNVLGGAISAP